MDLADRLRTLADLVPILDAPDRDFGAWVYPTDGFPYYAQGPTAEAFTGAVARGNWILVGFDWGTWLGTEDGAALRDRPEAISSATPDDLAMLLTAIVRSERFGEGSMANAFESGLLARIAARAAALLAELEDPPAAAPSRT